MDPEVVSLVAEVERLSATSRRQQRWLLALSGVLVVLGCAAARVAPSDVVRARRFEAVDAKGNVVAMLTSEWHWGAPALALSNEDGEDFAFLTRLEAEHEGTDELETCVLLHLEAGANDDSTYGVTTVRALERGGVFSASQGDDATLSLGIAEGWAGMQITRMGQRPLVEIGAGEDAATLELRDTEGKSLFRAP